MTPHPVHLNDLSARDDLTLWTGGWDSTYRLLQRVLMEERPVCPVYVVDRGRGSAHMELDAMTRLLLTLEKQYPDAYSRIEPPRYVDRHAIPPNPTVTQAWEQLRTDYDIGTQYDWLSRLATASGWTHVELSIYGGGRLRSLFGDNVERVWDPGAPGGTWVVSDEAPEPVRIVFGRFAFPLWETSKRSTFADAEQAGLSSLLDAHTWFCFSPRKGEACGGCRPCQFLIKDGLGHRIPASNRFRATAARVMGEVRFRAKVRTRLRSLRSRVVGGQEP